MWFSVEAIIERGNWITNIDILSINCQDKTATVFHTIGLGTLHIFIKWIKCLPELINSEQSNKTTLKKLS